jgi:hypothetical protein
MHWKSWARSITAFESKDHACIAKGAAAWFAHFVQAAPGCGCWASSSPSSGTPGSPLLKRF